MSISRAKGLNENRSRLWLLNRAYNSEILCGVKKLSCNSSSVQSFCCLHKRWRSRLKHCATSRKMGGSKPDSGRTQALTGTSTGLFLGDKGGRCVELTNFPPSCADCLENREPQPPGCLRACTGIASTFFYLPLLLHSFIADTSALCI